MDLNNTTVARVYLPDEVLQAVLAAGFHEAPGNEFIGCYISADTQTMWDFRTPGKAILRESWNLSGEIKHLNLFSTDR